MSLVLAVESGAELKVWRTERVARLPWPDATFTSAVSFESMREWAQNAQSVREVARVLRVGARLVGRFRPDADFDAWLSLASRTLLKNGFRHLASWNEGGLISLALDRASR